MNTDPYAAWRSRNYRRYIVGWFLLTFSNQISTVAVGIHLYAQTSDPMSLGMVGLVQALPVLLLAIPGGQLADRVSRKRVMLAMLVLSVLAAAGLAGTSYVDASAGWMYLLLTIGAIGMALGSPSRTALLPQLVEPEVFNNAMTWNTTAFHVATMSGPALGGLIMSLDPTATLAFSLVAGCRVLSLVAIAGVWCHPGGRSDESLSLESLAAGIRFVHRTKPILAAISLDLFAVLLGGMTYLLPVFAMDVLKLPEPERAVGYFRSVEAVGAVFMAVLLAHLPPLRHAGRSMCYAVIGFGLATVVFGLSRSFWLSLSMMFFIGALDNISVVVRHTLVQMLTPDAMRGRVSAVNNIFIVASNDLGGFESGLTARLFGPLISVIGGGVGTIFVVLGVTRIWPQLLTVGSLRDLRPEGTPAPTDHEAAVSRE